MSKPKYHREWLNTKNGTAMVGVDACASDHGVDAHLTLSDCSRQVTLEFYASSPKETAERLRKIDKIRKALDIIEDTLLEGLCTLMTDEEVDEVREARKQAGESGMAAYVDL